ncbi:MAG: sensor histidine kinase [Acidimicrobiia bacterium]|nr:sensor histidine kinase [Acidimicrobiia bacterium]
MTTLADLSREHSSLDRDDVDQLHRLGAEWAFLADLCFADLLLYVRSDTGKWLIVDQVRPATNQTIYVTDYIGTWADVEGSAILDESLERGVRVEGEIKLGIDHTPARMLSIPVRHGGRIIAMLGKEWEVRAGRPLGELERNYSLIFERFATMIESGRFPFMGRVADSSSAPRVGDGVLFLDSAGTVDYVSPNANSALHRVGIQANPVGMRLAELGFHDGPVRQAFEQLEPIVEEFEQGADVTLLCRCVPIVAAGDGEAAADEVVGGLLLVRDVTELRKRDRLLLSKDATIREIHHRVKNNLQTISSLLRLQARRLTSPEAKAAVSESVRRIRTIALVHESLSREPGEDIAFIEIVRPLLRLAEEGLQSPDRPVRFKVTGDGGRIPAHTATPLSVVLTELLQNAVDHGFPEGSRGGEVSVSLAHTRGQLHVEVIDNGRGVDPGFDLDATTGLGLSIVRTLVTTELNGTISMRPAELSDLERLGHGDRPSTHGTVVDLTVPTDSMP